MNTNTSISKKQHSIRKYSLGVTSLLISASLLASTQVAKADEQTVNSQSQTPVIVATTENQNTNQPGQEVNNSAVTLENNTTEVDTSNTVDVTRADSGGVFVATKEDVVSNQDEIQQPATSSETVESQSESNLETVNDQPQTDVNTSVQPRSANFRATAGRIVGDDYPAAWKGAAHAGEYDTWGYNKSTCTSFVAYRLHNVNKFETPRGLGNAGEWGNRARSMGYIVNNTPAVGSVAWMSGHVAWVADVSGNTVTVEEYNYGWNYAYHKDVQPISRYLGFIHFKDLSGGSAPSPTPAPTPSTGSGNLPSSGVYNFTGRVGIKNEPKISSPDVAYYDVGYSVNYDKVLEADGYRWISYTAYSGTRRYIPVAKLSTPAQVTTKGKITIQHQNDKAGSFDVVITDVSSNVGIKEVKVPIWSAQNGQDDISWYTANRQSDGTYKVSVNIKNHKNNRGLYYIHLYYLLDNGNLAGVGGTDTTISDGNLTQASGNITIKNVNNNQGSFDVIVSNVACPNGLNEVKVPVWTELNHQDDIIWYTATKQTDGTYKVSVNSKDHKNERGLYNIHLYYSSNDGQLYAVGGTQCILEQAPAPTGTIRVVNNNSQTGTFDVIISDVSSPKSITAVSVPIWATQNGQDDIIWYQAQKQQDGTYKVSVKASDHKNYQGEYNIHLYYNCNGEMVGVGGITTTVHYISKPNIPDQGTYVFKGHASIKAAPQVSSPELAYYDSGNSVNYDKVVFSDGHYWISYISYSGNRRYISIT